MQKTILCRRGLSESLETYCDRIASAGGIWPPSMLRFTWRAEGLILLGIAANRKVAVSLVLDGGFCRIAPGVAVPTKPVEWDGDFDEYEPELN
jgi:hypothetical protein